VRISGQVSAVRKNGLQHPPDVCRQLLHGFDGLAGLGFISGFLRREVDRKIAENSKIQCLEDF
jgi:hypothetical protein